MRVGFDVTPVTAGRTGVARYVEQLDRALTDAGADLRRFAIGRGPFEAPPGTRRFRLPLRTMHAVWRLGPVLRIDRLIGVCDVVHVTDLVPGPTQFPLVVTVHDLDALARPDLHGGRAHRQQHSQLEAARDRADIVIADSAVTADALGERGVDRDRIRVIHLGLTPLPAPSTSLVPDGDYVLSVGSIDARKGTVTLLEAFARARLDDIRLVVVGPDGHGADELHGLVRSLDVADRVVVTGRVEDDELAGLYQGALAFCFPSRAEGFGLPPLEAMSLGTPVVASDLPVLREVAGVAEFVPPDDVAAWADALHRVSRDASLRASLSSAGRERVGAFRWDDAATATVRAYEEAIERHAGSRR